MQVYHGRSVFGGIAIGKINIRQLRMQQIKCIKIEAADAEIIRYRNARETAVSQLQRLYQKALQEVGEANAAIFEGYQMLLNDIDFNQTIENMIRTQQVNVEYAVAATGDNFAHMFAAMEDAYMRERAADVKDISGRLLAVLQGKEEKTEELSEPVIIVAEDITPSEMVQLDKNKVISIVTVQGSVNSHAAILARTMGIPALIGTKISMEQDMDGRIGIVDGKEGVFYVEPDEDCLSKMREKQKEEAEKKALLQELKGKENITLDGRRIELYANIGDINDLPAVLQNDANGIGLFRSEFLYLEKREFPTEEEQFRIYRTVAETMGEKRVVIRTLDIGADKQCSYFHLDAEENPALGYRGIRICLSKPEIFKPQLRAIFRAACYGNLAVMYPMITGVSEVKQIQRIVAEVKEELAAEGVTYGDPKQGIMIETPSAAMMSEELAKEVDFFSIGTNDLAQYTLAIDRQNPKLEPFYEEPSPAVLKMIAMVVENAHKTGIPVGICGELAADKSLIKVFLKMGVDELSVSPGSILSLRKKIREINADN